jgi:CheY-like chemotaxis protein
MGASVTVTSRSPGTVEAKVVAPGVVRRRRPRHWAGWPCALAAHHSAGRPVEQGVVSGRSTVARRIVVVDDESSVRMICRFNLMAAGMDVREAVDGSEALSTIRDEIPDLVLLDVMMPNLDGWEVARALRNDPRTRELPIVFLTARAEQTDRERAADLGAVGYVLKPFDPVELPSTLELILERVARGERDALRRAVRERSDD